MTESLAQLLIDPNRVPSEFNHHVAGWALIAIGLLVLGGTHHRFRVLSSIWPALFLLAGLFLAIWSDAEMWPRGNLNWLWLLHHDAEARQHKIFAILLIGIGIVEYLRAQGALSSFWKTWAFPLLAIVGAGMLLVHDHAGTGGAHSLEVRAYLVNPALDVDGKSSPLVISEMPTMQHDSVGAMDHAKMDKGQASANPKMDYSGRDVQEQAADSLMPNHHLMSTTMQIIAREHFWFMILGVSIALCKLLVDGYPLHRRFVAYLWPTGMVVLGILLVLYHE